MMTNLQTTENYCNYSTFGGRIHLSDFDTNHPSSFSIIDRIVSDWKFDEQCRKNIIKRNKEKSSSRKG